jgi:hypothetical protein
MSTLRYPLTLPSDRVHVMVAHFVTSQLALNSNFVPQLPTEIQFLGSRPVEIHLVLVFINISLGEQQVCTLSLPLLR